MEKHFIGEWADKVWQLLSTDNRKWTFEEVQKITGMDERQLAGAIGWLAREDKIQFEMPNDGNLSQIGLALNVYIG